MDWPEKFGTRVAEEPFHLGIYQHDAALMIDDHHGVRRGFQEAAEFLFGLLAEGHVADGADDISLAIGLQRAQADFHGKLAAIAAQTKKLAPLSHGADARFGGILRAVRGMGGAKPFGHQQFHGFADQLLARVAKEFFGL